MTKEEHDKIIDFVNSEDYMLLNSYISKPYEETIEELDKEIKRLSKEVTKYDEILCERNNEVDRLNNIINEVKDYVKFLILFNQTINGKFSKTIWGREILDLLEDNIELVELKEGNINES